MLTDFWKNEKQKTATIHAAVHMYNHHCFWFSDDTPIAAAITTIIPITTDTIE
jgi:hypothetical protein